MVQKVKEINKWRQKNAPNHVFTGKSCIASELEADPSLELDFIVAPPRMAKYMEKSTEIFDIYLRYVSSEDTHVYSVDEIFIDATHYLHNSGMSAHELAMKMIHAVLRETGITATAGIGTNLYLCKIAMDIVAKKMKPDKDGVRIAELDEASYRRELWEHRPLTDFWRIGHGYAKKLEENGLFTMGDIARASLGGKSDYFNEDRLYKMFGVSAELLIDHAWGWEPCLISDIKAYRPENNSLSSGQVLSKPYPADKGKLVVREMTDLLVLDLVEKALVADQMVLTVVYDVENLSYGAYNGALTTDRYGRQMPKEAHGSINLPYPTSSTRVITAKVMELYDRIVDRNLLVRRMYVVANHVVRERDAKKSEVPEQLDLFTDYEALERKKREEEAALAEEKKLQKAVINIKKKYGKNAILKGMNFEEGATAIERNGQVGGHKA